MKYSLFFLLCLVGLVDVHAGRTVEDPVARHDARQCGTYLCKKYADVATAYLESGCKTTGNQAKPTSFRDFFLQHTPTSSKTRPNTSPTGGHSKPATQS